MQDSLNLQIRDGIMDYLANEVTLDQFLDQFMDKAEEVEEIGDPGLVDLVNTIKLYWAELTGSYLTQQEFRDLLRPFVEVIEVPLQVTGLLPQQTPFAGTPAVEIMRVPLRVTGSSPQNTPFAGMPDLDQSGSGSSIYNGPLMDEPQRNARHKLLV